MKRLLGIGYGLLLAAALTYTVATQRHALAEALRDLDAAALVGAFVALLAALWFSMLGWRAVLAELGAPLSVLVVSRIFYVGQLGKYLPGSVWPLLTQMQLGKRAGVPRNRMGLAGLVALGISVLTGALAGALCLPALGGGVYLVATVGILLAGLVTVHPRVLNPLLATALRLARRTPLERPLSGAGIARAVGWQVLAWVSFGLQAWLLVRAVDPSDELVALPLAVGAFALATTLGVLFVLAPAGAGVREGILVLGLAPVLTAGQATSVALVSRLLAVLSDAAAAGAALWFARSALANGDDEGLADRAP